MRLAKLGHHYSVSGTSAGPTSHTSGRAVRGKSCLGEAHLIWGASWLPLAWIDGRRAFDGGDVAAIEEAAGDKVGEAQDRQGDAVKAGGDSEQHIGDHGSQELQADGI